MTEQDYTELDADIEEAFFGPLGRTEPRLFSTKVEPALLLLAKLHELGWFYRIDSIPKGVIVTVQCITEVTKNPKRLTYQVEATTIPLAIALAAMKTRSGKTQSI